MKTHSQPTTTGNGTGIPEFLRTPSAPELTAAPTFDDVIAALRRPIPHHFEQDTLCMTRDTWLQPMPLVFKRIYGSQFHKPIRMGGTDVTIYAEFYKTEDDSRILGDEELFDIGMSNVYLIIYAQAYISGEEVTLKLGKATNAKLHYSPLFKDLVVHIKINSIEPIE